MKKYLCMEVGTSIVRLAEVAKVKNKIKVLKTFVFDTPDDATKDGKVRTSDAIIAAIRNGIDESGIQATDVFFVVGSQKILFKQVEMPFVSKSNIISSLQMQLQDLFHVDETLYHVSYVLERVYMKDGQKTMALDVFAIPNDLSESYYNLAVALGLTVKGLTDASRSMITLMQSSFKNRNVAMLNLNEDSSTITITTDGNMIFNKTIPYGVSGAIQKIINSPQTMNDLTAKEACEFLYTQNILARTMPTSMPKNATPEEKITYETTTSLLSLIRTVEQTLKSYLSSEKIKLQEFRLSGIGAGFAGITKLFESEYGIPVSVPQDCDRLVINPDIADDNLLLASYPAIGAIIDAANFFSPQEQAGGELAQKRKIDHTFIFIGAVVFLVSFGFCAFQLLQANLDLQHEAEEKNRLTKRITELQQLGVEEANNEYNAAVSYNEQVHVLYDETKSGNEHLNRFLENLEQSLPPSARVSAMTLSPSSATVSFICDNKKVAAGVLHLLRNMESINAMECSGIAEIEGTTQQTFQCSFSLKSDDQFSGNSNENSDGPTTTTPPVEEDPLEGMEQPNVENATNTEGSNNLENTENTQSDEQVENQTVENNNSDTEVSSENPEQ